MSAILLYDGVCNLCDASVRFVMDHERPAEASQLLRFAALQSTVAERLLTERGVAPPAPGSAPSSVILIDGDRVLQRSDAALRAASYLRWPYRALTVLRLVPRPLRDLVYNFIARNRYRWFGKHESCRLPTPALRARFLDQEQPGGGGGPAVNAQK